MDKNVMSYLESVIALQKQSLMQSKTLQNMDWEINNLGYYSNIQRAEVQRIGNTSEVVFKVIPWLLILPIIFAISGFRNGCISGAVVGALKGGLIGLGIAIAIGVIGTIIEHNKFNNKQKELDVKYQNDLAADELRVKAELEQKNKMIILRDELAQQHLKTEDTLNKYYKLGILPAKYWNMHACLYIYDSLETGVAEKLRGPDGAFDQYEHLSRKDIENNTLMNIHEDLEEIKNTQPLIYSAICETNQKMDSLLTESRKQTSIQSFSAEKNAITAYNSNVTRKEMQLLSDLKTYELTMKGL